MAKSSTHKEKRAARAVERQTERHYFGDVKDTKGEIHINKDHCKGCSFCVEYCPRDVLELSEEFNAKGYHPPRLKDGEGGDCCYCKLCEAICPEYAIFVTKKEEEE